MKNNRKVTDINYLPGEWRLGASFNGPKGKSRTVFFGTQWVEVVPDDEHLIEHVQAVLDNPHQRATVVRYLAGDFHSDELYGKRGLANLRALVKAGFFNFTLALEEFPEFGKWLRHNPQFKMQNDALKAEMENCVEWDGWKYFKYHATWCREKNGKISICPKKSDYRSIWDVRVAYGKGKITLREVAQHGWSTLLEVVGDDMFRVYNYNYEEREATKDKLRAAVYALMEEECEVAYFRFDELSKVMKPVYVLDPCLQVDSYKRKTFKACLEDVLNYKISGYGARLRFIDTFPHIVRKEEMRWKKNHSVFVPGLRRKHHILTTCTLEEVRDFIQKLQVDMISIGLRPELEETVREGKDPMTSFVYQGNTIGLNIMSGKIFSMIADGDRYIPRGFHKWTEEQKRAYLKDDYDSSYESYTKRSLGASRHYHQLIGLGFSARKAWKISRECSCRLARDFIERNKAAVRWDCARVNKTAQYIPIVLPDMWEVA